ncbi:catalase family peroxidase [Mycobacterium sp. 21AC1]|uniref:catalase family peroxidase n=1 Tax=[Mycobacterium] appelbergii TaxID=2939269 RepID=UPI002938ED5D|nr:catalase family peroxidase [Mycobacterium sp. 21AC1]MDV3126189.1 catalase family peroxidase [Mycobacterium sp. 21AC1]
MTLMPKQQWPMLNRRRILLGAAAVGGFLAVDVGALLFATNVGGVRRLTPQVIVDAFRKTGGNHPGYRVNHAKGVAVSGYFDSNGNGLELSRAAVFEPGRTPVLGRFSFGGSDPQVSDDPALARGLGLVFGFPTDRQWRTALLNLPVFPDNSPEGFYQRMMIGKDPEANKQFLADHPATARALELIKANPPTAGFADSTFRSLMTFYFISGNGVRTPVRWSLVPMQDAQPASPGNDGLFDAMIRQIRVGPLRWRLLLTVGEPQDPVTDATVPWPSDRRTVEAGILTLDTAETERPGNSRDINFDPTVLPDGIEPSEDPMLSARSAVYAASHRLRSRQSQTTPPQVQVDEVSM